MNSFDYNISKLDANESNFDHVSLVENQLDSYIKFRYILAWISFFVILIGLICNLISFLTFNNPKIRSSTNIFLSTLCACSFIALILIFFKSVLYSSFLYHGNAYGIEIILSFYPYLYPIMTTLEVSCTWLTVAISLNQFIFVVYSKGTRIISNRKFRDKDNKKAFKIAIGIILFSIIFCIPYWLKFNHSIKTGIVRTELGQDDIFIRIVNYCLYLPFACIVPFLIMITTNIYLIATLNLATKRRNRLSFSRTLNTNRGDDEKRNHLRPNDYLCKQRNELSHGVSISLDMRNEQRRELKFDHRNRTLMLVSVVFFFLICEFPGLFLHLYDSIHSNEVPKDIKKLNENYFAFRYYLEVSRLLSVINLSFNFAFFYLFSLKFRQSVRSFFIK